MSTWPLEGTTPLISDRYINTYYAGAAITMGQLLYISANNTVLPTTGANMKTVVGFAMTAATASGQKVSVASRGICRGTANGTISPGDQITSSINGEIQTDNSSLNTTIIGQCIQGAASGGTAIIALW
jgi:hypothetical protein